MRGCSLPLRLSYAERRATLEERCGRRARLIDASAIDLWRLARDHSIRPRPARNRRRGEDGEISVAARESIEADLAIPHGCKLTPQKTWRGTMLGRRPVGIDNADSCARLKRG